MSKGKRKAAWNKDQKENKPWLLEVVRFSFFRGNSHFHLSRGRWKWQIIYSVSGLIWSLDSESVEKEEWNWNVSWTCLLNPCSPLNHLSSLSVWSTFEKENPLGHPLERPSSLVLLALLGESWEAGPLHRVSPPSLGLFWQIWLAWDNPFPRLYVLPWTVKGPLWNVRSILKELDLASDTLGSSPAVGPAAPSWL